MFYINVVVVMPVTGAARCGAVSITSAAPVTSLFSSLTLRRPVTISSSHNLQQSLCSLHRGYVAVPVPVLLVLVYRSVCEVLTSPLTNSHL